MPQNSKSLQTIERFEWKFQLASRREDQLVVVSAVYCQLPQQLRSAPWATTLATRPIPIMHRHQMASGLIRVLLALAILAAAMVVAPAQAAQLPPLAPIKDGGLGESVAFAEVMQRT